MGLFDFQASAFGEAVFLFREGQAEDAVYILGFDLVGVYAGDVKASGTEISQR